MMDLLDKAIQSWTKGLSKKKARIKIFEKIRDFPYYLPYKLKEPESYLVTLKKKRGYCESKAVLLAESFKHIGIPVRYVLAQSRWDYLPLPQYIKRFTGEKTLHFYLEAKIDNKWMIIDPAWDKKLSKLGFPVNKSWNGCSDTKLAFRPLIKKFKTFRSFKDYKNWIRSKKRKIDPEVRKENRKFIKLFNSWIRRN